MSPSSAIIEPVEKQPQRLPAVPADEFLRLCSERLPPPAWLLQLQLPNERANIRCLLPRTRFVKRVLDLCVAGSLLVLSIPLLIAAALAIKISSPGPILFTQIRVGLNARRQKERTDNQTGTPTAGEVCRRRERNYGKPFKIYKLRTMHLEAADAGPSQAQPGDRRVFPVGRLLRRMRIDELPQLFNVLRGEMSMVGPRPECIEYMDELSQKVPNYLQRLGLKPGLTGIAQIEAGYANDWKSYRRKVAFDLMYLQNCCVWNDLRIMWRTIRVVMTGFGAL